MKSTHVLKHFLFDYGVALGACVAIVALRAFLFYESFGSVSGILFVAFASSLTCYPVFLVAMRWLHSSMLFLIASWLVFGIVLGMQLYNAQIGGLGMRVHNIALYADGVITPFGVLHELLNPRTFMALWATWLFFSLRGKNAETNS